MMRLASCRRSRSCGSCHPLRRGLPSRPRPRRRQPEMICSVSRMTIACGGRKPGNRARPRRGRRESTMHTCSRGESPGASDHRHRHRAACRTLGVRRANPLPAPAGDRDVPIGRRLAPATRGRVGAWVHCHLLKALDPSGLVPSWSRQRSPSHLVKRMSRTGSERISPSGTPLTARARPPYSAGNLSCSRWNDHGSQTTASSRRSESVMRVSSVPSEATV